MLIRSVISGVLAASLAASVSFAGDASPAGTADDDILVPVAPAGSLGGANAGLIIAGGALVLAGVALAVNGDDDDDDDSAPTTPDN